MDDYNLSLSAEKIYLEEKKRLEREAADEEYQYRLRRAATAKQVEQATHSYLLKLQKESNKEYLDELKRMADEEQKLIDSQKKTISSLYNDIAREAKLGYDELVKGQEALEKKLGKYGNETRTYRVLNSGEQWTSHLPDLKAQNRELEDYANLLERIKQRGGVDSDFFSMLRDMPIKEAMQFGGVIMSVSDEEFNDYIEAWKRKRELSKNISQKFYEDDLSSLFEAANEKMLRTFGEIPDEFWEFGADAGQQFADSLVERLGNSLPDIINTVGNIMAAVNSAISSSFAAGGAGGATTNNYTSNVTLTGGGNESVAQQLSSVQAYLDVEKLRGFVGPLMPK